MKLWQDCALTGIYTLSPTHCGTGQTTGAVDLPVARDATTGFPILPATGLKGVARDYCEGKDGLDREAREWLFGNALEDVQQSVLTEAQPGKAPQLKAGALVFTEGRLLAFPIRSLNYPFLYVTCPLILERLARDLRALDVDDQFQNFIRDEWFKTDLGPQQAKVADSRLANQPLVLEDLIYEAQEVAELSGLRLLGERLGELLPAAEADTRKRLADHLVLIPDEDFKDLIQRAIPVQARIKLTSLKTTGEYEDERGNLWYEEYLPSDCLFLAFIGERRQRTSASEFPQESQSQGALAKLREVQNLLARVQLGGNETVGHGLCLWTFWTPTEAQAS